VKDDGGGAVARRGSAWGLGPAGRRALVLLLLVVVGVSAFAVDSAVTVEVRWRVLPYQSLRLVGADRDVSSFSFPLPEPTVADQQRGYSDVENALRIEIASNAPWKLQVRLERGGLGSSLEVRRHGDTYVPLTEAPVILAHGANGTFDLGVDVRLLLAGSLVDPRGTLVPVVFTIMPD
jgi:hypothetical protein